MWQSFEEQADGSVMVTVTLPDLQWAASMALGFGPILTVLEPDELRQRVSEWAKRSLSITHRENRGIHFSFSEQPEAFARIAGEFLSRLK